MKRLPLPLLALLALALTPAVDAQEGWAYYGLSIGEFDYSHREFAGVFNDSADSWRLMVGYQLMEHFALEGSYGKTSTIRDTAPGSPPSIELGFETELSKIVTIRGLGTLPFDNGLSLMAGFGFINFEQDLAFSVNGAQVFSDEIIDESLPTLYFGVQYDWDRVALRLGYEKWDFGSATDGEEVALSFFYKL